jgi:hypothetical protein
MNTCKTCKYWGLDRGCNGDTGRLKSCSAPGIVYGYGTPSAEVPDNGAAVEDDEGWGMQTGPDFGCVLHVSSPATPAAG